MNISLRKAVPEDAKDVEEVYYKSWIVTYPNEAVGITKEDIEKKFENHFTQTSISAFAENIRMWPQDKVFLVAVDEDVDKVVGLCRLTFRPEVNQLQAIYVLPEYQHKGIGTKLWNKAQGFFDNEKDIIVQVATYNVQAISFYEKFGFIDTGKRFTQERHGMLISGIAIPEMEMVLKK